MTPNLLEMVSQIIEKIGLLHNIINIKKEKNNKKLVFVTVFLDVFFNQSSPKKVKEKKFTVVQNKNDT